MSEEARPRTGWRWGRWLLGLVLVLFVLGSIYFAYDASLNLGIGGETAKLDASDPGWQLADILAARGSVPDEENSIVALVAVGKKLPAGWPDDKMVKAIQVEPNQKLTAAQRATLDGLLKGTPRQEARELGKYRRGRMQMDASPTGLAAGMPEYEPSMAAGYLLVLDGSSRAQDGQPGEALANARVLLQLAQSLEDEPAPGAVWLRLSMRAQAFQVTQRALALGQVSDAVLAALDEKITPVSLLASLRTERAMNHEMLMAIVRNEIDMLQITNSFGLRIPDIYGYGGRGWRRMLVRREVVPLLRMNTRRVEIARLPVPDQFAAEDAMERENAANQGVGVFTKLFWAITRGGLTHERQANALGVAMQATIAVERYRLKSGAWPAKLEDTVPAFLSKAPLDPIDGAPLRFKRLPEGVVVYSVGNNRTDDGGDVKGFEKDFGFRLWDVDKRGKGAP